MAIDPVTRTNIGKYEYWFKVVISGKYKNLNKITKI